jgi:hypothetical protein
LSAKDLKPWMSMVESRIGRAASDGRWLLITRSPRGAKKKTPHS